jgi:energy-converting hydrogenase Eha subunit A
MAERTDDDGGQDSGDQPGGADAAREALARDATQTHVYLIAGLYAALTVGVAVTAILHDALGPASEFGSVGAQWTSSVAALPPVVAVGTGFFAGWNLDGIDASVAAAAGNAAGYLVLFFGTYVTNDVLLDLSPGDIDLGAQLGITVGIAVTGVLGYYVAENYEDWV